MVVIDEYIDANLNAIFPVIENRKMQVFLYGAMPYLWHVWIVIEA
jgi:hypothetical protein